MLFFLDVLLDAFLDTLKLLPFLFLTYLLMEWIEHKGEDKTVRFIKKAGPYGPLVGGLFGMVPQCGFSAAAANLYTARILSAGTLIAVFLSTSDEMLVILLTESEVPARLAFALVGIKAAIGILVGFLVDLIIRKTGKTEEAHIEVDEICEHDHCHCEKGVLHSALHHTLTISVIILLCNIAIGSLDTFGGRDFLETLFGGAPVVGVLLSTLIGLIPNCAASAALTEFYVKGILSAGALLAGLLPGAGVGLLVLFRVNRHGKQNRIILAILVATGIVAGLLFDLSGLSAALDALR